MKEDIDIDSHVAQLVERMFDECDTHLWRLIRSNDSQNIFLSMPAILITMFARGLSKMYRQNVSIITYGSKYRNVTITPNHELSIVLFHKDYALYNDPRLRHRILLFDPMKENNKKYDSFVWDISTYMNVDKLLK